MEILILILNMNKLDKKPLTIAEQEIIAYWSYKINEEQPLKWAQIRKEQQQLRSKLQEQGLFITPDMEKEYEIPVRDYEILQKNNVEL